MTKYIAPANLMLIKAKNDYRRDEHFEVKCLLPRCTLYCVGQFLCLTNLLVAPYQDAYSV